MRIAACLIAVVCWGTPVVAQGLIEWSTERPLTKEDFRGRVPPGASKTSVSWVNIDASWQCEAGTLVADVRATFDPARSWWRAAQGNIWELQERTSGVSRTHVDARRNVTRRDLQLLEHEQLHFDLTELAARRIKQEFATMKDACDDTDLTGILQDAIARADRALQDEQLQYDRETSHGTNEVVQDRWKQRIRKELGAASLPPDLRGRPRTSASPRPQ